MASACHVARRGARTVFREPGARHLVVTILPDFGERYRYEGSDAIDRAGWAA